MSEYLITTLTIFFIGSIGFIVGYLLLAIIGTLIPINRKFIAPTNGIDLYLSTNGMHINFILPCKNMVFDWSKIIDAKNFDLPFNATTFLSFGWGDKAIYLDIVEWKELTLKMGLATLFLPTPTIVQVTAHQQLPIDKLSIKKTCISEQQYQQLCQFILASFVVDPAQNVQLIPEAGYTPNDNFYQANGKYHAFYTCNTWVNHALRKIGVRTTLWTTVDRGVLYQFDKIV